MSHSVSHDFYRHHRYSSPAWKPGPQSVISPKNSTPSTMDVPADKVFPVRMDMDQASRTQDAMMRNRLGITQRDPAKNDMPSGELYIERISNQSPVREKMIYIEQEALLHGYTTIQAAGIIGNFLKEAEGLNTNPPRSREVARLGHHYTGLAQWNGSRQAAFKSFVREHGGTVTDFALQVAFVFKELEENPSLGADKLKQAKTAEEAAETFCKYFERPSARYAGLDRRKAYAHQAHQVLLSQYQPEPLASAQLPPDRVTLPSDIELEMTEGKLQAMAGMPL